MGADAIHPGYGFLSENEGFAERCEKENITFIGPTSKAMELTGDKMKCKVIMKDAKVPTASEVMELQKTSKRPLISRPRQDIQCC